MCIVSCLCLCGLDVLTKFCHSARMLHTNTILLCLVALLCRDTSAQNETNATTTTTESGPWTPPGYVRDQDDCAEVPLFGKCQSHRQCGRVTANSYCRLSSATCGGGSCTCQPGFAANDEGTKCLLKKSIGSRCSQIHDKCLGKDAECSRFSTCSCKRGYNIGPGGDCWPSTETLYINEECENDDECYADFVCAGPDFDNNSTAKVCQCPEGKALVNERCQPRFHGMACSYSSQCYGASVCRGGKCACSSGKAKSIWINDRFAKVCAGAGVRVAGESQRCDDNTTFCQHPMQCFSCHSEKGRICGFPAVIKTYSTANTLSVSYSMITIFASVFLLQIVV